MWWDVTAELICKTCKKKSSFFIIFISLAATPVLMKEPDTSSTLRSEQHHLPWCIWENIKERILQMERHQNSWKWEKKPCPVLSAMAILKFHWSPCNPLHSVTVTWVAARQMMFCRQPFFLDTLPGIHPRAWTSVHKDLSRKILMDFIV